MKKYLITIASVLLTMGLMLVACKKDPVNPNPHNGDDETGKKISKIYCVTTSETGTNRWLSEEWYWTANGLLDRIDHLNSSGTVQYSRRFVYEEQQLVRVNYDTEGNYEELQYENGKLKKILYYVNEALQDVYTFAYENGKVSAVTLQSNNTNITTIALTWNGGNISRMDYSEVMEDGYTYERSEEMQYDACQNPYYGWFNGDLNLVKLFSKNNLRSLVSTSDGQLTHQTFDYTYEDKCPKTQSITIEGSAYVLTYEFEYL